MHIPSNVTPSPVPAPELLVPSPVSNKRHYDCQSGSSRRSPLRNARSAIRSAWGNLRELVGCPSTVRRLRNTLPAQLGANNMEAIHQLMTHLDNTGERALHTQLEQALQQLQNTLDVVLKNTIEPILQPICELLQRAAITPDSIDEAELNRAQQQLATALDQLPDEEALASARKLLESAKNALAAMPRLLAGQRNGQLTHFAPMVQQARETIAALAKLLPVPQDAAPLDD